MPTILADAKLDSRFSLEKWQESTALGLVIKVWSRLNSRRTLQNLGSGKGPSKELRDKNPPSAVDGSTTEV